MLSVSFCVAIKASEPKRFADSIERVFVEIPEKNGQIEFLLAVTKKVKYSDPDQALLYATRALDMAISSDIPELKLRALISVGYIRAFKTQFTQAMEMALNARDLASKLDDKKALGEALLILGLIRDSQGNYSDSYNYHFQALRLFESVGSQEGIMKAQNGIGSICYYQGNYKKADTYYMKALNIAISLKDTIQIAAEYSNIGVLYFEQGQEEKALEYYQKALEIHSRMNLKTRLAANYISLGYVLTKMKRFDESLENYQKAIEIFLDFKYWHGLAISYLQLSDYYVAINDQANRSKYIRMAYEIGSQYKLRKVAYQASGALHDIYLEEGNIDSAYKYLQIKHIQKDSIDLENSAARLTMLEMEYYYDKKQKEEKLKQQRKDFYVIIFTILIIAGLIISFLFLSRQIFKLKSIRLEKKQLADELEFKNKELTINVMNLLKKNEFLVEHTNQLVDIQKKATEEEIKMDILRLINALQRDSTNDMWEEFELRFKQVHSGFYSRLLQKFPDLTSNELKLCALLKLNLSTKEICELTGQRPASLDVARSRLRKKLELPTSQTNLVAYLSQI